MKAGRLLTRLALAASATLLCLLALEMMIRWLGLFPRARAAAYSSAPPQAAAESRSELAPGLVLHPFTGWVRRPWLGGTEGEHPSDWAKRNSRTNFLGFYSQVEDYRTLGGDDFVVGVFGGSVANGLVRFGGDALEERLERRVSALEGRVRIINFGLGGYKQPQQLIHLAQQQLLGVQLDVVVNIDGYNEVALGGVDAAAGIHPLLPSHYHYQKVVDFSLGTPSSRSIRLAAEILVLREGADGIRALVVDSPLGRFALFRALAGRRLQSLEAKAARLELALEKEPRGSPVATLGDPCLDGGSDCWELIADLWQRSSEAMSALAEADGSIYLHLLQPNQYVADSKPLSKEELKVAFRPDHPASKAAALGYPLLRRRGTVLRDRGVDFHDLTGLFGTHFETLYRDACCHFNWRGNQILGRATADLIAAAVERHNLAE